MTAHDPAGPGPEVDRPARIAAGTPGVGRANLPASEAGSRSELLAGISVGVSTLDRPQALARCIDALLQGSMAPAEILIVDQGTDEATAAVIEARRVGLVPLIHIRQSARGLSASRNDMIRSARTGVLAVTDDDCVPAEGWLAAIAAAFRTHPAPDAVTGRVKALGPDAPGTFAISLRESTVRTDFTRETAPWMVGTGANFAARIDWLRRLNGYDERLGAGSAGQAAEDLEICHRLLQTGARIRYEPDAVVYHERQDEARRMATRSSYGHGIGATCGMLWRRGDRYAPSFLTTWLLDVAKRFARGVLRRDPSEIRQAWLSLTGTMRGFVYGWRAEKRLPAGRS